LEKNIKTIQTSAKEGLKMKKLMELLKREDGVTAPEYALIAALIAVVIIGAVTLLGQAIEGTFTDIAASMP
jgi:pilus assembly protein Flp/PilA